MSIADRWHKVRPSLVETRCPEHDLVPAEVHGLGHRWQVRYRDDTGRQRKKNFPKKVGRDPNTCASAFEAKIREQLNTDSYVDPDAGRVLLKDYAEQWRSNLTSDPMTIMQITNRLTVRVYPTIGMKSMGVLAKRPSLVQQWIKGLEAELEPSTIHGIAMWVSTIFNAAVDDGIVGRNPFHTRSVRLPKTRSTRAVPWSVESLTAVALALPERFCAMAHVGAGCGLRQGEIFGLAVDSVDFLGCKICVRRQIRLVNGVLVFAPPKGGKEREVPLPESVGRQISAHMREYASAEVTLPWRTPTGEPHTATLLFTEPSGEALDRNKFNRVWRRALHAAGLEVTRKNGTHVLRHTAASAWLAAGVDIRTVAEFLGHNDPGFTLKVYTHLMPDATDRARKAMDAFFLAQDIRPSALDVPSEVTS